MKFILKNMTIFYVALNFLMVPVQAQIPFTQAKGMYENTKDEYKKYSPFWAMVAIHGGMLENMRFFGNYHLTKNEKTGEEVEAGKDAIATLIKSLFNSPDGVQFVATTYENDPVGNLSRNLGKINDIIAILLEEKIVVSQSDQEEIINLVAKKRQLGDKGNEFLIKRSNLVEEKKDKNITAERRNEIDDEVKKINEEISSQIKEIDKKIKELKSPIQEFKEKGSPAQRISQILDGIAGENPSDKLIKANGNFANIIVSAFNQQQNFTDNVNNPDKYLYPENIVITALLAFFVQVADDKSAVDQLTFFMKNKMAGTIDFTLDDYYVLKEKYGVKEKSLDFLKDHDHPEEPFFLAKGFNVYESPFMQPINYLGSTPYQGATFADCGEGSLLNVLGIFLSAGKGGIISEDRLKLLENQFPNVDKDHPFFKMMAFFRKNSDFSKWSTVDVHREWAEVVSNLNIPQDSTAMNAIRYGRSIGQNSTAIYEIKANVDPEIKGIINMLNVIAHLMPDKILTETWSEDLDTRLKQVSKKLTQLCKILSIKKFALSWKNKKSDNQKITNEFPFIIFESNYKPVFKWSFVPGHFQLDSLYMAKNDWRVSYQGCEENIFQNEWMASLFLKLTEEKFIENENYGNKFPLSLIYHRDIWGLDGTIHTLSFVLYRGIMNKKMIGFYPFLSRWIEKSIPLNDPYSLDKISALLCGVSEEEIIKNILSNEEFKPIEARINILLKMPKESKKNPLQLAADNGLNTALIFINKIEKNDAFTSLNLSENEEITDVGLENLVELTSLDLSFNNKITNVGLVKLQKLKRLNLTKNKKITDVGLEKLSELTSLNLSYNEMITDSVLGKLPKLTELNLNGNRKITKEAIEELKRKNPNIKITGYY